MSDQKDCVFCDIVAGKAKAYKIYEDEHCRVFGLKAQR